VRDLEAAADYFTRYAAAFDAMDPEAVASFYHAPCLLVRSGSAVVLASAEAVLANMRALVAAYRSRGYERATFSDLEVVFLDRDIALVSVPWTIHLRGSAAAESFRNTYQLAELGGRAAILVSTLHATGGVAPRG
jgi:hypothetical protein